MSDEDADSRGRDDEPLADLRDAVNEEATHEDDFDALFEESGADVVDGEDAWDELLAEQEATGGTDHVVETDDVRDVRVIESYICHGCPYFTDPPEVACTHDGTTIREVVDTDHFEVADCPMVADDIEE